MRRLSRRPERKKDTVAGHRLENLSHTVNDLFQKAVKNEEILRRYQQFEFKLLDVCGLESLLDMLLCNALDYFQLDRVELWLYDPQHTLIELLPEPILALPSLHIFPHSAPISKLYGNHPEVRLISVEGSKPLPVFIGQELSSTALLPLVRHGVLVGSLHFGSSGEQRFTLDKSTDFIAHLARVVAVCLENAVNHERLHRLSMYDVLTQVKNRRAFHMALDSEVSRATRGGDALSVLFVDLDYFKKINDTYGHPMGDKVLKNVAQYINNMLRKTDHVCRYGGEEFALVLPNCGKQRALDIAERIRQQISELMIDNDDAVDEKSRKVGVTLSIGVCCWAPDKKRVVTDEAIIARELIACSDQGVYLSKAAGRNCVHYVALNNND